MFVRFAFLVLLFSLYYVHSKQQLFKVVSNTGPGAYDVITTHDVTSAQMCVLQCMVSPGCTDVFLNVSSLSIQMQEAATCYLLSGSSLTSSPQHRLLVPGRGPKLQLRLYFVTQF